jgi:regulator of RNase E activity RraA
MSAGKLTPENREALKSVSTATLTTALFKRGLRNVYIQGAQPLNPDAARMVGEAYTIRYIPAREDLDHIGVFADPEHPQRKSVEEIPPGHVMVIDGQRDRSAATGGSILMTRLKVRGAAGLVTDSGLRDTPELRHMDFPLYAACASAPTNLTKHHAVDLNVPVGCGGVPVFPGDIIVGDGEGVVVIPAEIANEIAVEATAMTIFEDWVEEKVRGGRSIRGLYPPNEETRAEFDAWKAANKK